MTSSMDLVKNENIKVEVSDFMDMEVEVVKELSKQITEAKDSTVKALETAHQLLTGDDPSCCEYLDIISSPLMSALDSLNSCLTSVQSLPVLTLSVEEDKTEDSEDAEVDRPLLSPSSPSRSQTKSRKHNNLCKSTKPVEVKCEMEEQDGDKTKELKDLVNHENNKQDTDPLASGIKTESEGHSEIDADTKSVKHDDIDLENDDTDDMEDDEMNDEDYVCNDDMPEEDVKQMEYDEEGNPKVYRCPRCEYSTTKKYYFEDHTLGTLRYRKCPWCEVHIPNTGFKALQKHFKTKHGSVQGNHSKCLECDRKFNRMRDLEIHLTKSHPEKSSVYHCSICSHSSILYDMVRHQEIHSANMFPCRLCSHKAKSELRLRTHINEIHKVVTCPSCNQEFKGSYSLRVHKRESHGEGKKRELYCDECGQKYSNTGSLSLHKQSKHSDKVFQCDKCEFTATNKNSLGKHMKTHNLVCDLCTEAFNSRKDFNEHMKGVHGGHKYRCDQCEFSSAWRETLKNHISSKHSREGLYKCDICGAGFPRRNTLQTHMQIHDDREKYRTFECSYVGCSSTFTASSQLKKHVQKVHEGVRWPCDRCEYIGSYKEDLKLHVKAVHEGFKLKCDHCDFTAIKNTKMKVHVLKVHEGITWPCDKCDFVGDIKDKLNAHVRAVHKGLVKKCSICSYTSITNSNVKRHMRRIHKIPV